MDQEVIVRRCVMEEEAVDIPECTPHCPDCCDQDLPITFKPCEDVLDWTVQNVTLKGQGRLLKVRVQLKNVCRGRNIRMAVLLCEKSGSTWFLKGLRTCEFSVPGSQGCLETLTVGDFCFIVPQENICNPYEVAVHVIAHYSSFPCFPYCPCP